MPATLLHVPLSADAYASGALLAAAYFADTRRDWFVRLREMAVFTATWPLSLAADLAQALKALVL